MKYIWLALPLILGLAACSKIDEGSQRESAAGSQTADARGDTPPGIDPSVAPGVAFDFRYGFSLPERQIATVQEAHAALCGKLGVTHCRVTAVHFDKKQGGRVDADMNFLVDPTIALGFARDATAVVEKSDGTLATSHVVGEDVGKTIVANDKTAEGIRAELTKIDAQLRIPGLSKDARGQLVAQSGELRGQFRALVQEREAGVESLATTPVRFDYDAIPVGFGEAWRQGISSGAVSATAIASLLAYLFGLLGPWAILAAGIWWGARLLRNRKPVADLEPTP